MRRLAVTLAIASVIAASAASITNDEIRGRTAQLEQVAAKEPPLFALDTLLRTAALVKPYVPNDADRLYRKAVRHARRHSDIVPSYGVVQHWMTLDPESGEPELRRLSNRRRVLDALRSYYAGKNLSDRAASLAAEAIRTARQNAPTENSTLRAIAAVRPIEAAELFAILNKEASAQSRIPEGANGLLEGLFKATENQPDAVRTVIKILRPIFEDPEWARDSQFKITTNFEFDGRRITTADSRSTMLEHLTLLEKSLDSTKQDLVKTALRTRRMRLGFDTPENVRRPPVPADLSLEDAIARINELQPPKRRLDELWRYLIGKQRTDEEAKPIVARLIEWANTATQDSDPFWLVQSLLNVDGRLGPPGQQWLLPPALRPTVFNAALRIGQKLDRDPETLETLVLAMRAENLSAPADVASARARIQLADLRAALEARYSFTLRAVDGRPRSLEAERGKVVVLNFWATWCGPCREEMPIFSRVYESMRKDGVEIFAITSDAADAARGFTNENRLPFPVLLDEERKVFEHYRIVGLPQTFVIDPTGKMAHHFNTPIVEEKLRSAIAEAKATRSR